MKNNSQLCALEMKFAAISPAPAVTSRFARQVLAVVRVKFMNITNIKAINNILL